MRIEELEYALPEELIAQEPLAQRDQARLLVLDRQSAAIEHSRFYKLPRLLREGDLLVLNDTRVMPARMFARKESGGRVELLFVRPNTERPMPDRIKSDLIKTDRITSGPITSERPGTSQNGTWQAGTWQAMIRTHRALPVGTRLLLDAQSSVGPQGQTDLKEERALVVLGYARPGRAIIGAEVSGTGDTTTLDDIIRSAGTLALPHYIHRAPNPTDLDDYQTIYASHEGAIAAPTAGLHFTDEVFQALAQAGVRRTFVTLHIGPGTFAPLRSARVEEHSMEAEWYTIPREASDAIEHAKRTGGRVIAVGTSAVRLLESWAVTGDTQGLTGLFIHPGFRFKLVDAMITNFHMPRTTVLALVMALAGRERILAAYREAIRHRYRFLSYGDAMLIL